MEQRCIYGPKHGRSYESELEIINNCKLPPQTRDLIRRWATHLFAKGSKNLRVTKVSTQLRRIAEELQRPLNEATREDIEQFIASCNQATYWSEATKADYRRCIKQFYHWFEEYDPRLKAGQENAISLYKYLKNHVRVAYKERSYDYSQVISDEDLQLVVTKGCANVKEKALLQVLHEGGFRAAEHLNIKLADIEHKEDRIVIKVSGKTGTRRVPLVQSMGCLARWLDEHPDKENPQAYLWTGDNRIPAYYRKPLKHGGAQKIINKSFERAGLKKKHNMHWFRHSRATINAPHMTEVIMCRYFGWVVGSKEVRRYVHSNVGQVEDAVLAMNGLQKKEEGMAKVLRCSSCQMINEQSARYCHRCGKALSVNILMQDEEKKTTAVNEAFELLQQIMSNPDMKRKFTEYQQTKTGT